MEWSVKKFDKSQDQRCVRFSRSDGKSNVGGRGVFKVLVL